MLFSMILTPKPNSALKTLLCGALALFFAMPAPAQGKSDDVLLEMQQAFKKGDKKRLAALLPQARGHVLEPWGGLLGAACPPGRKLGPQEVQRLHDALRRHLPGRPAAQRLAAAARASAETGPTLPPNTPTTACATTARSSCYGAARANT
jgi:hypothetical protein